MVISWSFANHYGLSSLVNSIENCVPLAGTGGGSTTAGDADSKTPAATTTVPKATTVAPKATTKTPASTTKAPSATTTLKPTTKAPASTKAEVGGDATEKPAVAKNSTMDDAAGVKCKVKST